MDTETMRFVGREGEQHIWGVVEAGNIAITGNQQSWS